MILMRNELQQLVSREAFGITRYYPGGCPYVKDTAVILMSRSAEDKGIFPPVAQAWIYDVQAMTIAQVMANAALLQGDGWDRPERLLDALGKMYNRAWDNGEVLHRLCVRVKKRVDVKYIDDPQVQNPMLEL